MKNFYVTIGNLGKLTAWGQFDPEHPEVIQARTDGTRAAIPQVLRNDFAHWAVQQKPGFQLLAEEFSKWAAANPNEPGETPYPKVGDAFWLGEAASIEQAVKELFKAAN